MEASLSVVSFPVSHLWSELGHWLPCDTAKIFGIFTFNNDIQLNYLERIPGLGPWRRQHSTELVCCSRSGRKTTQHRKFLLCLELKENSTARNYLLYLEREEGSTVQTMFAMPGVIWKQHSIELISYATSGMEATQHRTWLLCLQWKEGNTAQSLLALPAVGGRQCSTETICCAWSGREAA